MMAMFKKLSVPLIILPALVLIMLTGASRLSAREQPASGNATLVPAAGEYRSYFALVTVAREPLFINEILVGNASTTLDTDYYNYSSWIEIYNAGNAPIDLKGYTLAYWDNGEETPILWAIPAGTTIAAGGYALFWADEHDTTRHTSFKLDMRGDKLALRNPSGGVVDEMTYDMRDKAKNLLPDIAYGRRADGGSAWAWFDSPTPGASNDAAAGFDAPSLAGKPVFSLPGGFYATGQSITLSAGEPGGQIRYTLDGSIPGPASALYAGPIAVTRPSVVRARVYAPDKMAGPTVTQTYLVGVATDLPVVSLATAPAHLWDDTIGIYVKGTNGIPGRCSEEPVNWNQKWERPASIEMYENGERVVAQDVGFEIHGACSRLRDQKSLEIKARRTYGAKDIKYPFFQDKPIKSYKRLILRNSGNDEDILFRDLVQQYIVKDMMDIDYQAGRPVVVFLNGEYWGIHNLREKADEAWPEQNYGLDKDTDFDFFTQNDAEDAALDAGSRDAWDALHTFVANNDLSVPANYDYVASQVDIDEFMNYFIVELYGNNLDWPHKNIRYWRAYDGGKWRWVLYDLDLATDEEQIEDNILSKIVNVADPAAAYQTLLFRKLMENTAFRDEFVQRFAGHINITFDPARVEGFIGAFQSRIASEVPAHIARWGRPASISAWHGYVDGITRLFYNGRQAPMRAQLDGYLGSLGMANLTIDIAGGGDVRAASVVVPDDGYTGPYFKGVPVTLEAAPRAGWMFVRWQETGETDPRVTVMLDGDTTRTAVFEAASAP